MKKICLISVITLFGFINASAYVNKQGCDWPNGNSHRADWNEDFGGWGEYWQWVPDEDVDVRNYYVVGCNVFKNVYQVTGIDFGRDNSAWPTINPKTGTGQLYKNQVSVCVNISQLEGGGGDLGYLNSNQYPWYIPNIPVRTPYDGDINAFFLATDYTDDTKTAIKYNGYEGSYAVASTSRHWFLEDEKDNDTWNMLARFEDGITTIPHECFAYNKRFIEVRKFPSSIHTIKQEAFMYSGLKDMKIGEGVKRIEHRAFAFLDIEVASCRAVDPPYCDPEVFYGTNISNKTLVVPLGSIGKYRNHSVFKYFGTIKDTKGNLYDPVTSISFEKTQVPMNVGDSHKLNYSVLPAGAAHTVSWSSNNSDIASVTQDGTVTLHKKGRATITVTTHDNKTSNCIVDYQTTKEDGTLEGACGDNIIYTLKDSIFTVSGEGNTYGYYVPGDFSGIKGEDAGGDRPWFSLRKSIKHAIISEGITDIGGSLFAGCDNLVSVVIPQTVINIRHTAFFYCYNLKSITFPDNLQYIGQSSIRGCESLTEITLPVTFPDFQYKAFAECYNLKVIRLLNPAPAVWHSTSAFDLVDLSDVNLIVPTNTTEDYRNAKNGINSAKDVYVWRQFKSITEPLSDIQIIDTRTNLPILNDSIYLLFDTERNPPVKETAKFEIVPTPPDALVTNILYESSAPTVIRLYREEGDPVNFFCLQAMTDDPKTVKITSTISPGEYEYHRFAKILNTVSSASALEVFTDNHKHKLIPEFDKKIKEYTVITDPEHETITINATPTHQRATTELITRNLEQGVIVHEHAVFSEASYVYPSCVTIYKITIIRPQSVVATLHSLETNPTKYEFDVSFTELNQEISVEYDVDSIKIIPKDLFVEAIKSQIHPLKLGENLIKMSLIGSDGTIAREYNLKITRLKDSDATLKSITIDTFTLTPQFNPTTFKYYLTVPNEVNSITVKAEGNGFESHISGTGRLLLNVGKQKQAITIFAMDGTRKVYYIDITRAAQSAPNPPASIPTINPDVIYNVYTLTGIYLGRYNFSDLNRLKRHKVVIFKNGNETLKIKL